MKYPVDMLMRVEIKK